MRLIKLKDMTFRDNLSRLEAISVTNIMNVSTIYNILRYTLPHRTEYWAIGGIATYQDVRHIKRPLNFTMPNNQLFMREIINGFKYS